MRGFNIYFTGVFMPGFWCACSKGCCRCKWCLCWNGTGFGVHKLMSQRPASVILLSLNAVIHLEF